MIVNMFIYVCMHVCIMFLPKNGSICLYLRMHGCYMCACLKLKAYQCTVNEYKTDYLTYCRDVEYLSIIVFIFVAQLPARIYMWTLHRVEVEGADVQLYCRPTGSGSAKVTWFDRNGEAITKRDSQYEVNTASAPLFPFDALTLVSNSIPSYSILLSFILSYFVVH